MLLRLINCRCITVSLHHAYLFIKHTYTPKLGYRHLDLDAETRRLSITYGLVFSSYFCCMRRWSVVGVFLQCDDVVYLLFYRSCPCYRRVACRAPLHRLPSFFLMCSDRRLTVGTCTHACTMLNILSTLTAHLLFIAITGVDKGRYIDGFMLSCIPCYSWMSQQSL